jgi:DNA polymerase III subunit chi
MTRIDFYILNGEAPASRELFACRLAEKVYMLGQGVYIHTGDARQTAELDRMLWTFKQNSFVPHGIEDQSPDPEAAVLIGHSTEADNHNHALVYAEGRELLINLAQEIPLFFSSFKRVAEIVGNDEQNKNSGRERYRFYRDRGYTLESHTI